MIFCLQKGVFWPGAEAEPPAKVGWDMLAINLAGACSIFVWSGVWSVLIFGCLKWAGLLRIDRDTEFRGNDVVKHGEAAYPVDAWVSAWVIHGERGDMNCLKRNLYASV